MSPLDWFLSYRQYLFSLGSGFPGALSFSDWITAQGNQNLSLANVIDFILESQPFDDVEVVLSLLNEFSSYESPYLSLPFVFSNDDYTLTMSLVPTPVVINRVIFPNQFYHVLSSQDSFQSYYPYEYPYYYSHPKIRSIYSDFPIAIERLSFYPIHYSASYQTGASGESDTPEVYEGIWGGFCASASHVLITFDSPCDYCCCGSIPESEQSMANCQDLINKLDEILVKFSEFKDDQELIKDFITDTFDLDVKGIRSNLNKVQSHLGQRLPHRDFTTAQAVDSQRSIQAAGSSVSQRVGMLTSAINPELPLTTSTVFPEITNENLDTDTVFDDDTDSPGDGGGGGGGGGGGQ